MLNIQRLEEIFFQPSKYPASRPPTGFNRGINLTIVVEDETLMTSETWTS